MYDTRAGVFHREVGRLLRTWGVPSDVTQTMARRTHAWGRFILSLPDAERKDVAQGKYLRALARFESSPSYMSTGAHEDPQHAALEGIVIIISPHAHCIQAAQIVAAQVAGGVDARHTRDVLDQAQLRMMAECGGVVFATVMDGSTIKVCVYVCVRAYYVCNQSRKYLV
jgi:hypothetical protein